MPVPNINAWIEDSLDRKYKQDPNAPSMGPADPNAPFVSDVPPDTTSLEAFGYGALSGLTEPMSVFGHNVNPLSWSPKLGQMSAAVARALETQHPDAVPLGRTVGEIFSPPGQAAGWAAGKVGGLVKRMLPPNREIQHANPLPRGASNPGEWDYETFTGPARDITPNPPDVMPNSGLPALAGDATKALPSPPFAKWQPGPAPSSVPYAPPPEVPFTGLKEGFSLYKPTGEAPPPMPEYDPMPSPGELKAAKDSVQLFKNIVGKKSALEKMEKGGPSMSPVPLETMGINTTPDPALPAAPQPKMLGPKTPEPQLKEIDFSSTLPEGELVSPQEYVSGGRDLAAEDALSLVPDWSFGGLKKNPDMYAVEIEALKRSIQDLKRMGYSRDAIKDLFEPVQPFNLGDKNFDPLEGMTYNSTEWKNSRNRLTPTGQHLLKLLGPRYNDAFKSFYGKSVTADEQGLPRLSFHASTSSSEDQPLVGGAPLLPNDFRRIRPGKNDIGAHFGTPEAAWQVHGESPRKRFYPTFLSIQNPLDVGADFGQWGPYHIVKGLRRERPDLTKLADDIENKIGPKALSENWWNEQEFNRQKDIIRHALKNEGYDALQYKNNVEDPGSISYDVFDPSKQVKSLFNQGTWDPNIDDILKGLVPPTAFRMFHKGQEDK